MQRERLTAADPSELDDLMWEWHLRDGTITKSTFANAICGVELAIPWLKKQLPLCRSELNDWDVVGPVSHHPPLPRALALLLAVSLAAAPG